MSDDARRAPYWDELAELRVLAAIIDPVTPGLIERVVAWLEPQHFFLTQHRKFYEACCALYDAAVPITNTSVKHWLEDRQRFTTGGGGDWDLLLKLSETPFEIHIEENARRIVNKWTMERVVRACETTVAEAATWAGETQDFAERFAAKAAELGEERDRKEHGLELFSVRAMIEPLASKLLKQEPVSKCTTGIGGLDDDIGGLAASMVTFVAADTNWGKTNLAIMIADENLALGKRVLVVSAEDSEEIYGRRILARRARVNAARLRERQSHEDELTRIFGVVDHAPTEPFFLRAIGAPVEVTAARVQRLCERYGIELVILDYIQAFRMARRVPDRRTEVNEVARIFTNVIKRARAAGLAFSQIKRLGQGRTKPTKHDLKESGDLENAAEAVLIGYRKRNSYRLLVDKSKDGTTNEYELAWDGNACCFLGGKLAEITATPGQLKQMEKRAAAAGGAPRYNGRPLRDEQEEDWHEEERST